jgi:putative transcriptional regulator
MNSLASLKNNFLIAMPSMNDPFFHQSVIYLCEHSDNGAMGLIINRPSKIMLSELLDHLKVPHNTDITDTQPILFGGPVAKNQGLVLHDANHDDKTSVAIADNIFLSSSTDILTTIGQGQGPENSLITLGYSSWQAGQLEQEIVNNDWLTVTADEDILFHSTGQQAWQQAALLLGVDINLMPNTTGHA